MKREIKFRAWHKGQKEMFTALYLTFSGRIGIWNNEETEIDFTSEYPYLELMQYTGLKDKNGKEIYEGDIVSCTNPDGDEDETMTVEWDNNAVTYPFAPTDGFGDYDITSIGWAIEMGYEFEVIGNIYENPERINSQ